MTFELRIPDERMKLIIRDAAAAFAMVGVEFAIDKSMTGMYSQQEIVTGIMAAHGLSLVEIIKTLPISDADRTKALEGTFQAMRERFNVNVSNP